jgi:hypothetical protein
LFEIGNTLREARLRRGLDIADCESATKIRAKYLRALEEEQFEVLPGSMYVKSFLRTYAEHLDLDGRLVTEEYDARFTQSREHGPDGEAARRRRARRRSREGRVLALCAGVVMLTAIGAWAAVGDNPDDSSPPLEPEVTAVIQAAGAQPTYVEVREGGPDGQALISPATIPPGTPRTVSARTPFWVHVGDGSGVRLTLDGERITTPKGRANFLVLSGRRIRLLADR